MAEITGLLNRRTVLSRTGGSNPPLTAKRPLKPALVAGFDFLGARWGWLKKIGIKFSNMIVDKFFRLVFGKLSQLTP